MLFNLGTGVNYGETYIATHHCLIANNVIDHCKNAGIKIGAKSYLKSTLMPFANLFANNIICGVTGKLLHFEGANDNQWRATSLWPERRAQAGAQPLGVAIEQTELIQAGEIPLTPASRAARIREFIPEIAPLLAAMHCPRPVDEVFPTKLEVKVLQPGEVGPAWMEGKPELITRIPNPQPVPPYVRAPKNKKNAIKPAPPHPGTV